MKGQEAAAEGATPNTGTWRDLAVARSLDPARVRAENRVQRFLDAALDLMSTAPDKEFTVQEVVERSGQSLRSFYQYFAGKHELLLALFEESVRSTVEHLDGVIAESDDPGERLHRFVTEYYRICRPAPKGRPLRKGGPTPALAEFAQQLLTSHPNEAARAFAPLVTEFEQLLSAAADAGVLRPGLRYHQIAGIILQAVMFNAFASTISGPAPRQSRVDPGEELWELVLHGIAVG